MTDLVTFGYRSAEIDLTSPSCRLAAQTDALIDAISGSELEGLPVPAIHAGLCARLRAMGLEPDEPKVLRVAIWINGART